MACFLNFTLVSEKRNFPQPRALRVVGKMRGCAQARLVECDDGHEYVVKFTNNPQKRRTLVNEVIASEILADLGLPIPAWRPVRFDEGQLRESPIMLQFAATTVQVPPGLHFGSRYCGKSSRVVYDWLPSSLLRQLRPMPEFLAVYVADQWISNRDKRQAVFYRDRSRRWKVAFIDHGYAFGGSSWDLVNSFDWGTFVDPVVYRTVRAFADLEYWISRITMLPDHVLAKACQSVPNEWVEDDEPALRRLIMQLADKKRKLPGIIERLIQHPCSPFQVQPAPTSILSACPIRCGQGQPTADRDPGIRCAGD